MSLSRLFTAAALTTLLAGPAFAGPDPAQTPPVSTLESAQKRSIQEMADEARAAPPEDSMDSVAPAASTYVGDVSANAPIITIRVITNGPVPDTAENRAKYGAPMSRAGKRTAPAGN